MILTNKEDLSLKNVNLKTLLMLPPDKIIKNKYSTENLSYGLAMLLGFLRSKNYEHVDSFYFQEKKPLIKKTFEKNKQLSSFVYKTYNNLTRKVFYKPLYPSLNEVLFAGLNNITNNNSKLYKDIIKLFRTKPFDLLGFAVGNHNQLYYALQIAKIVKSVNKNVFIVFGGPLIKKNINYLIPSLMKKAGCKKIVTGLESMSPRILKLMNKMHSPSDAHKILFSFKQEGFEIDVAAIFGFPSETISEALTTLNFLKKTKKMYNLIGLQEFALEEDTLIYNNLSSFGIKVCDQDKDSSIRFGYKYYTNKGLNQKEAKLFTDKAMKIINY